MASKKQLPALPRDASARHSYSDRPVPVLPPIEIPQPLPLSASREFSASVPDVSRTRTSPSDAYPAPPYLGQGFYLAPRAHLTGEDGRILGAGSRATWTGRPTPRMSQPYTVPVPPHPSVPARTEPLTASSVENLAAAPDAVPALQMASLISPNSAALPTTEVRPAQVPAASAPEPARLPPKDACNGDQEAIVPPISATAAAGLVQPCLIIEHRASWIQTELFLTFSAKEAMDGNSSKASGGGALASSMLIPRAAPETAGRFRVWLSMQAAGSVHADVSTLYLLWDRKQRGGFPELPELKRLVRDKIAPAQSLGHSEK
ncbi:hypothetical protein MBRA1_001755 [Malassezia brasiliensis]|uniref:Uncharacterized protein n=1 Tax=Malassezia brasiliensis TaxID=1821822 RepID=A0AAF0DTF1_9BASI|nr:hypothetical protein MBRA1_001755 [Malassezia brasiliensis]